MFRPLAAVLLTAQALPALAADIDPYSGAPLPPRKHEVASPITDHFYISAAYYAPRFTTNFRVDPSFAPPGTVGTPVSGENDLGLPHRQEVGRVDFMFRLRDRNKVQVGYYETNRSGNELLTHDIVFGNETFPAGQMMATTFELKQFHINYTYSFIRNSHFELGSGLAAYLLQLDVIGQAKAQGLYQEVTAATPFPALPLDLAWAISKRWAATGRVAFLWINHHNLSGRYWDTHADLQYRWLQNFTVGAGYSSIRSNLTHEGGSFPGVVDLTITGPELFLRFSF
ncbi:MAG TPA: hypothetical protein VMT66_02050 [Steroidobacteraceae bacterium]|nr:hypothetical protein [Steroidobacteraceae bacterium]